MLSAAAGIFLFTISDQVRAQALDYLLFAAFVNLALQFFQAEVHHVVVVQFFRSDLVAESQPEAVQQIHFVGGQVRRVRAQNFVNLVAIRQMHFQIELRLRVRQSLPRFADLPRLLFALPVTGSADHDGGRLQAGSGAQNTVPKIVCGDHRKPDGLAAFFRHAERLRKKMLLDAAEELIGVEFLLAGGGAPQDAHMQYNNVAAARLHSVQNITQMIHIEMVAYGNENVAGFWADRFRSQLAFQFQVELVHFHVRHTSVPRTLFRNGENDVQQHGKHAAGHGGYRLGKQIDERDQKKCQRDQSKPERNLFSTNRKVERNLEFALAWVGVAQYQHRQAVHGETPDHAECVQVRQEGYVAAADENGDDLQNHDDVDDAIAGAKTRMRLAKPVA